MLTSLVLALTLAAADGKPDAIPDGWPDLFPTFGGYTRIVKASVVKGEKSEAYSQSTYYSWNGGRYEAFSVTLARDPAFKEKYSAEAMKGEKAEKLEVNKKPAYLWELNPAKLSDTSRRLVVILADDKVLLVEQAGEGARLPDVAKKLDFDKVLKALENPPPKPR